MSSRNQRPRIAQAVCLYLVLAMPCAASAADIQIINDDRAGVGFNDTQERNCGTLNPGETLGECRLNAFRYAAELVASKIQSDVTIRMRARFAPANPNDSQFCAENEATLGAAGPLVSITLDGSRLPRSEFESNTFYPVALANALAGQDLAPPAQNQDDPPGADIGAEFNGRIDNDPKCLVGINWYYGFDSNPSGTPPNEDLDAVATIVHELIHGLGFLTGVQLSPTDPDFGEFAQDTDGNTFPFIYDTLIRDLDRNRLWPALTISERRQSIENEYRVILDGKSTDQAAEDLDRGTVQGHVRIHAPATVVPGSSISHWADELTPNALMEPEDTGDINVNMGLGLATCLLDDIGWELAIGIDCPDEQTINPNSFAASINFDNTDDGGNSNNSNDNGSNDDDSGGGGCTLSSNTSGIAPLLPLLLAAGLFGIGRQR